MKKAALGGLGCVGLVVAYLLFQHWHRGSFEPQCVQKSLNTDSLLSSDRPSNTLAANERADVSACHSPVGDVR